MSKPSPSPRQRAVRLTPHALEILKVALDRSWREAGLSSRLTRQVRAELMGVSVPTAHKILANEGVDRTSLFQAFALLGEPWFEAYIYNPDAKSQGLQRRYLLGVTALAVVVAIGFMARANPKPDPNAQLVRQVDHSRIRWIPEYDAKLGTDWVKFSLVAVG